MSELNTTENNSPPPTITPALSTNESPTPTVSVTPTSSPPKNDSLTPVYAEKMELESFLRHGYRTGTRIMLLTLLGLGLFLAAMLYWQEFDYFPNANNGEWMPYASEILPYELRHQTEREWATYAPRPQVLTPTVEKWPLQLYKKLRFDIYVIAGLVFLLGFIVAKIENAKAHRRELLILRALLREIEKNRPRKKELTNKDTVSANTEIANLNG